MRLRVLGCSGGIGKSLRTTSFLVDDDILVDAGTGVGDLTLDELVKINHLFITHSHLDHITSIPFLIDTVGWARHEPVIIHATQGTIDVLKNHIFNWMVWPDFAAIPAHAPFITYDPLIIGKPVQINSRRFTALPANHVVPAVGFWLDSGHNSLVFSGDTTSCSDLWDAVNQIDNLRFLLIETSFREQEREIAIASKHLCPSLLSAELKKLRLPVELFITHLKPHEADSTMKEIQNAIPQYSPQMLLNGQILDF